METRKRRTFDGRKGLASPGVQEGEEAKTDERNNLRRRTKYANDPRYAKHVRQQALAAYRREHPLEPSRLRHGLLGEGIVREVTREGVEAPPVTVACYTIPEAARALGRSTLGFKRWITEQIIPPPILRDTTRRFLHYSQGELSLMAGVVRAHERENRYITTNHTDTITRIWQVIRNYRASHI